MADQPHNRTATPATTPWVRARQRIADLNPLTIGTEVGKAGIDALASLDRDFGRRTAPATATESQLTAP